MRKTNQMGIESEPAILASARTFFATVMLFMGISILALGGLTGNAWAVPGGPCIEEQIKNEPFNGRGLPKEAFTILLNDLATGTELWRAPYKVNTGGNTGWISGERTGYRAAFMFLVDQNTAEVLARVFFVRVSGAGYDANRDGNFLPAVAVYYDVLSPNVKILQEAPK